MSQPTLRDYVQHKCALSITYQQARAYHFENHDGSDDWPGDIATPECGDSECMAWAAAGPDGRPDCTCGLDTLLAEPPDTGRAQEEIARLRAALRMLHAETKQRYLSARARYEEEGHDHDEGRSDAYGHVLVRLDEHLAELLTDAPTASEKE